MMRDPTAAAAPMPQATNDRLEMVASERAESRSLFAASVLHLFAGHSLESDDVFEIDTRPVMPPTARPTPPRPMPAQVIQVGACDLADSSPGAADVESGSESAPTGLAAERTASVRWTSF